MKISVYMEPNVNEGKHSFNIEDLNLTKEEWDKMSESDRQLKLQECIDDLPEQPCFILCSYKEL